MRILIGLILIVLLIAAPSALAAKKVLCTITINSDDEGKVFRRNLSAGEWEAPIELVDQKNPDWFKTACRRNLKCDVVIISGHFAREAFAAGTELENIQKSAYLNVEDMERASCSNSCPGIFANPKEIYMFGCNTLNLKNENYDPSAQENNRSRMRRIFAGVPVVYGFASSAPLGPQAAHLLNGYFRAAMAGEIGSGRMNHRMISNLAAASMTAVTGMRPSDVDYVYHNQVCTFYNDALPVIKRSELASEIFNREFSQVTLFFDHLEKYLSGLTANERRAIQAKEDTKSNYVRSTRNLHNVDLRIRMLAAAETMGWLTAPEYQDEILRMVKELFDKNLVNHGLLSTVCPLNSAGQFASLIASWPMPNSVAKVAVLACFGHAGAAAMMIDALGSANPESIEVAQNYFRQRPLSDGASIESLAQRILNGGSGSESQLRALETLARFRISDAPSMSILLHAFAGSRSALVQQAIVKVFLFADLSVVNKMEFARVIRDSRLPANPDATEFLLQRLR